MIYAALLRGVNVGGKNLLPMKHLAAMFTQEGCASAQTYIQSGNVIFHADPAVFEGIAGRIGARIAAQFGFECPLILRSAAELRQATLHNPFLQPGVDEKTLHVYFLADLPKPEDVARLDPARSAPDAFAVRNREIYGHFPNGLGRTKLTNAYFDSKLRTASTARNWRTVLKLDQLLHS